MQGIIALVLLFVSGVLVKLTDAQTEHGLKLFKNGKYFTAIVFGGILGYLVGLDARVASLILGVIAANILMRKFDDKAFWVALVPLVGIVLLRSFSWIVLFEFGRIVLSGFSGIVWIAFAVFLVSASFDEFMNDRRQGNKLVGFLSENRLFAWVGAAALSMYLMEFIYFFGIVCFDLGYIGFEKVVQKNGL